MQTIYNKRPLGSPNSRFFNALCDLKIKSKRNQLEETKFEANRSASFALTTFSTWLNVNQVVHH